MQAPAPFFEVRVSNLDWDPTLIGLCVGYELGLWREDALVDHLMEWLPEFCLTFEEISNLDASNMVSMMREAVRKLYISGKFERRGEFGEVLLHAAVRQAFSSIPAISKIFYKSALNETVKGFDAVHVVPNADELELWLGEVKFYKNLDSAIRDVVEELHAHLEKDYLRDEFLLIKGKIDDNWPYAEKLKKILHHNTSLDEVFSKAVIPVLLTYESQTVLSHTQCSEDYKKAFQEELIASYKKFTNKDLPKNIAIHLFLVPIKDKADLIKKLDQKLKIWQAI